MLFHFSMLLLIFIFFKAETFAADEDPVLQNSSLSSTQKLPRFHFIEHKNSSFTRRKNLLSMELWNKASPFIEQKMIGSVHFKENLTCIMFNDAIEIVPLSLNEETFLHYYKAFQHYLSQKSVDPRCYILHALSGELTEKLGKDLNMNIIYSFGKNLTLYCVVEGDYTKNSM